MKKILVLFTLLLSFVIANAQNNCPLRMKVTTAPGDCYNNSFIQIDLVNADGTPLDTNATDLSNFKFYCINTATEDTTYSYLNAFTMAPGTYIVGVQAVCHYSYEEVDSAYILLDTNTTVTTTTTYITPALSMINNAATTKTAYGTVPTLPCMNTGRVQLKITGGKFPYYVAILDANEQPLDTISFAAPMYNGTTITDYNYKDYYSIDNLAPGKYFFYVWDECGYHLPKVWQTVPTAEAPYISNVCWYPNANGWADTNQIKHSFTVTANGYYKDAITEMIEYRYIYPEIDGVQDTSAWRHLSSNSTSVTLIEAVPRAHAYCDMWGKAIKIETRTNVCNEHRTVWTHTILKPQGTINTGTSWQSDSSNTVALSYDSCGYYDSRTQRFGHYDYSIEFRYRNTYYQSYTSCNSSTYVTAPYQLHYTRSPYLYWVYADTLTHQVIKIDTLRTFSTYSTYYDQAYSYLRAADIVPIYGSFTDSAITIPVQRTLYDAQGCELYTRFDNLTFKNEITYTGGSRYTRTYDYAYGVQSTDGRSYLSMFEDYTIPMRFNGNCMVELISSPNDNFYNYTATFDQTTRQWTIVKENSANHAIITLDTNRIYARIADFCLPNGTYQYRITTDCDVRILTCTTQIQTYAMNTKKSETSSDYCCSNTRYIRFYESNPTNRPTNSRTTSTQTAIPLQYKGDCTVELIESPWDNQFNFTATYTQATGKWTITKASMANLATITTSTSSIDIYVKDYCLPSGRYTWRVSTPCSTSTHTQTVSFNSNREITVVQRPKYEFIPNCTEMNIKPVAGKYEMTYYNTNTSGTNINQPYSTTSNLAASFQVISGPTGGYNNTAISLNGTTRITMPGTYVIKMYNSSYTGSCGAPVIYDTIRFTGGTVEYEYDYAYVCDSTSTTGFVRVKGKSGTEPYTYTLYSAPNMQGAVLGVNNTGIFDDVPLRDGQQVSVKIEDACLASFDISFFVFDLQKAQKCWFTDGVQVTEACEGSYVNVYAIGLEDEVRYLWEGPNGFSATTKDAQIFVPKGAVSGWYYVNILNTGCLLPVKDSVYLTVKRVADVVIAEDATICPGESVTLNFTTSGGVGDVHYTIAQEENSVITKRTYTNNDSFTYTPNSSGIFWVNDLYDDQCPYNIPFDTVTVTLKNHIATACDVIATPDTVCLDSNAVLYAYSTLATPYTLRWYEDYGQTNLLKEEVINSTTGRSQYDFLHLSQDTMLYVTVENAEYCETKFGTILSWMNMSSGNTDLRCGESIRFYDAGGVTANYPKNQNTIHTFTSTDGEPITLSFSKFYVESEFDKMLVFNGSTTDADSLIATLSGNLNSNLPEDIVSEGSSLTVWFLSNGATQYTGWEATVSNNPKPTIAEAIVTDTIDVQLAPFTAIPVHYNGDVTMQAVADGGRHQLYQYEWQTSTDSIIWNTVATVTTTDTSRQTLTHLTEPTFVRVILTDKSVSACDGADTAVYFLPIGNIKLALQLDITQDYYCSPYYTGALTVRNSATALAENVTAKVLLPEGISFVAPTTADFNFGNVTGGESATLNFQVKSSLEPLAITELMAKAQIWSCLQGDSVPTVVYGDWDWVDMPRQVDEDTAKINVWPTIPVDLYQITVLNDTICYGGTAELVATSNLSGTLYFNWYEDATLDHYVGSDIVTTIGGRAQYYIPNVQQEKTYYVNVGTDDFCPTIDNLQPQTVAIKAPLGQEIITATDDNVCYDHTAGLTASSDIAYPQYYTWWDKDQTTLLARDKINSGVSHFNPEHQISDTLYYVHVYNETNCPYVPEIHKHYRELRPAFIFNKTIVDTTFVACEDSIPFFDAGGENGNVTAGTSTYYYQVLKAEPGSQIILHIDTLNLYNSTTYALKVYDGKNTSGTLLANLYGAKHNVTITSTSGYLYLYQRSRSTYMGWNGYITTTCEKANLAEAHVSIKAPLGRDALTATNDTVCYDYTADLTASSSLTYPQYYTWWASDGTTLLQQETINTAEEKTHFRPEHQISDSLYFVHVYDSLNCPYIPSLHTRILLSDYKMNQTTKDTTFLACGDSIPFYDHGGKTGNTTTNSTYYRIFKAEPGKQVTIHIDTLSLINNSSYYLKIYDGVAETGTPLANLYGNKANLTYTSTKGALYVRHTSYSGYMGWEGSVTTNCFDLAESHVSIRKPLGSVAVTATNDTVCYDYTADLTATSSLTYPQYYTWWDKDRTTLLGRDTVTSGVSHFNPEHQISDSLYYVHVYDSLNCPYMPEIHKWIGTVLKPQVLMNSTSSGTSTSTTIVGIMDSIPFYDNGGKTGNTTTSKTSYYKLFTAAPGQQVVLHIDTLSLYSSTYCLKIYDGTSTSDPLLATLYSPVGDVTYKSTSGSLYLYHYNRYATMGWEAIVTTDFDHSLEVDLAEAHVAIKAPLGKDALTATNDTVCYDYTADLTATSSLTYPQYYTWWANDATTLLQQDTINTAEEKTHYRPEHQISDSLYYVHVYDSLNCAYIPSLHARILLSEYKMNQTTKDTTFLSCGDSIPFYDQGGRTGNTTTSSTYYRIFKAEPGKQVTIHIDTLSLINNSSYYLKIYDGVSETGTPMANLYGNKSNLTYTSTKGALYVRHYSYSGYMGWEGSVVVNCNTVDLAEAHVSIKAPLGKEALTANNDTVCYDNTADLTASSTLTYPQYYTWWNKDRTTLLGSDTVAEGVSHFNPEHQISDSLYYVHVYDSLNCPYVPEIYGYFREWTGDFLMTPAKASQTTTISCLDSLNFYDEGGKTGDYTQANKNYYHTFTAAEGEQIVLQLNSFISESISFDWMCIYDGKTTAGTLLDKLGGDLSASMPKIYTSTTGSLTVSWKTDGGGFKAGWEGSITTDCDVLRLAESHVSIHPAIAPTSVSDVTCQSSTPYTYQGFKDIDVSTAGVYTIDSVFQSVVTGCDSAVTLTLTVNPVTPGDTTAFACNSFDWYEHTGITTSCDNLTHTFTNAFGCDSIVTLHLTIGHSNTGDTTAFACDSFDWYEHTGITTSCDNLTHTFTNASGCDSIVTLYLTVNPSYNQEESLTICQSELPYTWRDTTFNTGTVTDDYIFNRHTVNGCDSIVTLHLTVNPSYNQEENLTLCQNELPYTWRDTTFKAETVTGDYIFSRQAVAGCDSIVTLHLTVNPSYNQEESLTICQSELPYEWRDTTFNAGTVTDDYIFNRQTVNGCDSIVTLHLTVNPSYNQEENLTICQNELPYDWRDTTFQTGTITGDYVFNRQTVNGCDSIVTLHLTVNPSYNESETATICQNELPYEWRDTTFLAGTVTGDYVFNKQTVNGCDSIVTLHLTVNPSYNESETATICQSELPYEWRDTTFQAGTITGDYVFSKHTVNGCDSIVTLHLTVNPSYNESETATICQNELPYTWRDTTFKAETVTGDYIFSRQAVAGCDSIVTLHLTVNPSYNESETATICQSELPYDWRDTTFKAETVTGDYVFNRQTVNGCDSIVTLHLTVKPAALDMDDLTDYIRCNGGTFSVTPTGNIPEGTQYVWTVEDNANVTGQSAQTTPVDAPISQTLVNNSSVAQTVIYHVTPMTNDCTGDEFTITVEVEPTPELTMNCPDEVTLTLEFGSCALLIAPADLGTPTWAHSLGWSLINISNNLQEGELYPEGDHIITWTMSDECGNMTTCDQHVHVIFPQCPDAVDYEGNVYHGVRIDCDCWTQRNLESHKYSDGTDIPGIYSYISDMYPDSAINAGTFGLLYDWESAIRDGQDNGHDHVQGICPEGWYLPTAEKYDALNAHGAAALKSPDYWIDGGGNNSTGFTSLPGGYYDGSIERYINLMGEAYYWSTTKVNGQWSSSAYTIQHACDSVNGTSSRSGLGYSVRCILEKN